MARIHTLILTSFAMLAASVASAADADADRSSTCCDYEHPSGVKLFVEHDRMYRVSGADIAEAIENANRSPRSEDVLGLELFVGESAGGNAVNDTADAGGFTSGKDTGVFVVDAMSELGVAGVGRYAVRAAGQPGQSSSVHWNGAPGIAMPGGYRYEVSFRLYCDSPEAEFASNLVSDISNFVWLRNTDSNHPEFTIEAGRWNEVRAWVEMPDVGDHVCTFAVTERTGKPAAWYVDGFSVRRWEKRTTTVAVRDKSVAEEGLTLYAIRAVALNVYHEGETVPIIVDGTTADGRLTRDTVITFWGSYPRGKKTARNPFTKENVYSLRFDSSDPPNRFRHVDLTDVRNSEGGYRETWSKTARLERNKLLQYYQAYEGTATDRIFWTEFKSPHRTAGKRVRLDELFDLTPGTKPTEVRISLWGNTDLPLDPDHDWSVHLNDGLLGHARWDGPAQHEFASPAVADHFRSPGDRENVVDNGSFEVMAPDGAPQGWYVAPPELQRKTPSRGVNAASGERYLALKSPSADTEAWGVVGQMLPALEQLPGERIRITVQCRVDKKSAGVISIGYGEDGTAKELIAERLPHSPKDWESVDIVATIPDNIDPGTLRARIVLRPMAEAATILLDDFRISVESGSATDAVNVLHFTNNHVDDTVDAIALDWIELDYMAQFAPRDDFLAFELPSDPPSFAVRTAAGFSDGPLELFDLTAGVVGSLEPVRDRRSGLNRTEYHYAFDTGPRHFRVAGSDGFLRPERMVLTHECAPDKRPESPEYVVVTHGDFVESLVPLMEHRERQGLTTLLVDVEHLYDRYTNGLFSAEAIRMFVDDLQAKSDTGAGKLRYLFLVGDASYDYMGLKKGSPNFVPTHHVYGGSALLEDYAEFAATQAVDEYFAYGANGESLPRVAVGRVPCADSDAVVDYVRKVLQYEAPDSTQGSEWSRHAAIVCSSDFVYAANDVATLFPEDWKLTRIVGTEDAESDDLKREETLEAINSGCSVLTFVGHGGYYMWRLRGTITGTPDLITPREVGRLTNSGEYPIVFTVTCFSALFDAPTHTWSHSDSGIGVYFVEAPNRGAIALIGGVGKVYVSHATSFSRHVLDRLTSGSEGRLGDAFLAARLAHPHQDYAGIALVGDPALRVQHVFGGGPSSIVAARGARESDGE